MPRGETSWAASAAFKAPRVIDDRGSDLEIPQRERSTSWSTFLVETPATYGRSSDKRNAQKRLELATKRCHSSTPPTSADRQSRRLFRQK